MSYFNQSAFKAPKYLVTTHTSAQITTSTINTYETILGSEISYIPFENSSKVVYEISFYSQKTQNGGILFQILDLEESTDGGSSWSIINNKFKRNYGNSGPTAQENRYYIHYRYVLPAWSGERHLRLRTATHSASVNRSVELHQLTEWGGASATDQFCNTNLLVYSI